MRNSLLSQLNKIEKEILKKAEDIMVNKVADEVIKEGKKQVTDEVYSKYTPKKYERTYGLMEEWDVKRIEGGVKVRNTRSDNGKYIPQVVESGDGYEYTGYGHEYEKPRPFIRRTKEELKRKGNYVKILKRELGKTVKVR